MSLENQPKKRTSYTGSGLAVGAGIGVALGTAFDQLAMGLALGTALGALLDGFPAIRDQADSDST